MESIFPQHSVAQRYSSIRILKGSTPGDIPSEQATKFEIVLNLKGAKTLGFEVPTPILLRADEVIE
jgi:putative ABC transport system substrate-binding protein